MDDIQKLYCAALAKENITELPTRYSQAKFRELCQRAIDDNPGIDFTDKINVAHFYLRTLLRHPTDNI